MSGKKKRNSIKSTIYSEIRSAIITGEKKPGERIDVETIKNEHGVSVTTVREALQKLGQEHLVAIRPQSGYYVMRLTLKELRDLLELREILETSAVEMAACNISDDEIKTLEQVHKGYTGDDRESYTRYTDENRMFHTRIARASGNDELAAMLSQVHDRLARFMVIRQAGHNIADIHNRLLEKLKSHDVKGASDAIRLEMRDTKTAILDRIMREEGEFLELGR